MRTTLRSVVAVVVGFVLIGVLSVGTDLLVMRLMPGSFDAAGQTTDPRVLALVLAYVGVHATFGCYVAARLAPGRPMAHAIALGLLGLAMNVAVSSATWDAMPTWYIVIGVATTMLWAWLGGRLRERELGRRGAGAREIAAGAAAAAAAAVER